MLRSLRWRMVLGFVSVLLLTLLLLGFVLGSEARHDAARALEGRLTAQGRGMAGAGRAFLTQALPLADLEAASRDALSPDTALVLLGADGSVLYASPASAGQQASQAPEVQGALAALPSQARRPNPDTGVSELHLAFPIFEDGVVVGALRVSASRRELGAAVRGVVVRLAIVGSATSIVAGLLAVLLSLSLAGALRRMGATARGLAAGQLYERSQEATLAETQELAHAINEMAASLEHQVRASYQERDTFGAVIDTMADGLLVVDQDGAVTLANPAALQLFRLEPAEVLGKRFIEVVKDHEIAAIFHRAIASGRQQTGQVEFGPDLRLLQVVATPIEKRPGPSVLLLLQDLTEVQRLQATGREFVANVSHELRTPLASIKAAVEVLQGSPLEDRKVAEEFLDRIHAEVDHLTQLVQRLLDLSRLETGKVQFTMKALDVRQVIEEVADRLRPQVVRRQLSLLVEVPDELPQALADRAAVQEVLLNLLDNAIKFTDPQGTIRLSAQQAGPTLQVTVEDSGEGIDPAQLPHIFERFYKADRSRSSEGAGLGLALAKHIVQAHGGRIWAESVLGRSSAFHFTLPLA